MFFVDEIRNDKIFKRKCLLPLNDKNKKLGSAVMLLTPNQQSSLNIINSDLIIGRYFNSYYIERMLSYYITTQEASSNYSIIRDEIITEKTLDVEKIINGGGNSDKEIIFHGFERDTDLIMKYINLNTLYTKSKKYGKVTFEYPITVNIHRNHDDILDNYSKNIIDMYAQNCFNKSLFDTYEKYIEFCMAKFILMNINELVDINLLLLTALYAAGVKKTKDTACNILLTCIEEYVIRANKKTNGKGFAKYINDIIKNKNQKDALEELTNGMYIAQSKLSVLDSIDSIDESYILEYTNSEKDIYGLNKEDLIIIGENSLLVLNEDAAYDATLKKILYSDRMKTGKELLSNYRNIKENGLAPSIKYTFLNLNKYGNKNIYIDLYYNNMNFIKNNTYTGMKGFKVYTELMTRLINDSRLSSYEDKTIIIPIIDWDFDPEVNIWDILKTINPISCIYKLFIINPEQLKSIFGNSTVVFLGTNSYFKINFSDKDFNMDTNKAIFLKNIKLLRDKNFIPDEDDEEEAKIDSPKVITMNIIDKLEKAQGVTINNIKPLQKDMVTSAKDVKKNELVKKVATIAKISGDTDNTIKALDNDEKLKELMIELSKEPDNGPNIDSTRASRMIELNDELLDKQFKDKKVSDLLSLDINSDDDLPTVQLDIDSVNPEWDELKYISSFDTYNLDADMIKIFNHFTSVTYPMSIRDIKIEDTSTSEDAIYTYTVDYEDYKGKRFTIVLDIPKLIDNKYMILRGNRKDISGQLLLMPIIKTDEDTLQIVSFYNKIFIRRFGTTTGKSNVTCDKLIKTLMKNEFKNIYYIEGDNSRICSKYHLPIDYIDLATSFSKIITPTYTFIFNQDELRSNYKIDDSKGVPIGIDNIDGDIIYYNTNEMTLSYYIVNLIFNDDSEEDMFQSAYDKTSTSVRYTYSKASIMNSKIPLIVILAYHEGLVKIMNKANIKFSIELKRPKFNESTHDIIKFKDGYILYEINYSSSLLMNGLKACPTDLFELADMNKRTMYLEFLDNFGGRIKSDGLDNFYDMMVDPVTSTVLSHYKLPNNYIDILIYSNALLSDNKFVPHTKIRGNRRIRRNEQIADFLYKALSASYGSYATSIKHGRSSDKMTIKRSAVIDQVLLNNTTEDQSIINALHEYEAYNTVSSKGPSGMNSERSYSLDKRSYDESMFNILGMSTGFAGNVGISRQATIDMSVNGTRGYIDESDEDTSVLNPTKSYCMTEGLTPFGTTRDDPFRTAMNFIQTSKHGMRCNHSDPLLITTGADEALPYMISNTFAHKASQNGKVLEITEDYMIVQYKDGTNDYVNLSPKVEKNSSSGFYVELKLDTDLKVGSTIKKGDIIAYDKSSFRKDVGYNDNLAYNIGTLSKIAILNTDEGYEDSAIISEKLSKKMTSDVILCKSISVPANSNIYNLVEKGQPIQEGEPLVIIQSGYDDDDANQLLANLIGDEEEITNLGRVPVKSKVTGIVEDIVIKRTVDKSELSATLKKYVNKYEKSINQTKEVLDKYNIDTKSLPSTNKLEATGKLKGTSDGVLIEIYLKYNDKMSVGDKLIYYSALKGVVKDIFPEGKEPYSEFRPNEKIDSLLSVGSVNGRMTTSILITSGINKGLIELSRKCKDIAGIKWKDNI